MLRTVLALFLIGSASWPASAQVEGSSTAMTCGQAAALVRSRGAVVLGTGGRTYDRFVSDRRSCQPTEDVRSAFVPTRDSRACFVGYTCYEPGVRDDF